jgi:hypothetical protein
MLLEIGQTTPRCPMRLLDDEYTEEFQLPGGEYTGGKKKLSGDK